MAFSGPSSNLDLSVVSCCWASYVVTIALGWVQEERRCVPSFLFPSARGAGLGHSEGFLRFFLMKNINLVPVL